jgi:hypothetical protein
MAQKKKCRQTQERKSTTKQKKATPWERPAPSRAKRTQLTAADKSKAKKRARRAGRPYPNLVDNMSVAKQKSSKKKTS